MNYLLDANTLIDAKNRYYDMAVCPGFWDWVLHRFERQELSSIEMVGTELRRGNDELAEWATANRAFFLAHDDDATQQAYGEVAQHVAVRPNMHAGAMQDFLTGADPWLIAKARVLGATVVTLERPDIRNRRRFLIPDVCDTFEVPWMNTFDLLRRLTARFEMGH